MKSRMIIAMFAGIVSLFATYSNCSATSDPYYGKEVGPLPTLGHGLAGTVYVVDEKHIRIRGLSYDGTAPAAFFWVGLKGKANDVVDTSGVAIPNEKGSLVRLQKYVHADVTLTLPANMTVSDLKWFSVWCKQFEVNFGNVFFSSNFDVPRPRAIGKFSDTKPGSVSSGPIIVLDDKTVFIENFSNDGLTFGFYFAVGSKSNGTEENASKSLSRLARKDGGLDALPKMSNVNVTLSFPDGKSIFDVDYLGVFGPDKTAFGLVNIPASLNVPPTFNNQ